MNIDLETLKKIHKVYDLMTVRNNDEAYSLLGEILQEKQFILPVVGSSFCEHPKESLVELKGVGSTFCCKCKKHI